MEWIATKWFRDTFFGWTRDLLLKGCWWPPSMGPSLVTTWFTWQLPSLQPTFFAPWKSLVGRWKILSFQVLCYSVSFRECNLRIEQGWVSFWKKITLKTKTFPSNFVGLKNDAFSWDEKSVTKISQGNLHPWKLTCTLKINGWKMYFLLKWSLFGGHVNFQGNLHILLGFFPTGKNLVHLLTRR